MNMMNWTTMPKRYQPGGEKKREEAVAEGLSDVVAEARTGGRRLVPSATTRNEPPPPPASSATTRKERPPRARARMDSTPCADRSASLPA